MTTEREERFGLADIAAGRTPRAASQGERPRITQEQLDDLEVSAARLRERGRQRERLINQSGGRFFVGGSPQAAAFPSRRLSDISGPETATLSQRFMVSGARARGQSFIQGPTPTPRPGLPLIPAGDLTSYISLLEEVDRDIPTGPDRVQFGRFISDVKRLQEQRESRREPPIRLPGPIQEAFSTGLPGVLTEAFKTVARRPFESFGRRPPGFLEPAERSTTAQQVGGAIGELPAVVFGPSEPELELLAGEREEAFPGELALIAVTPFFFASSPVAAGKGTAIRASIPGLRERLAAADLRAGTAGLRELTGAAGRIPAPASRSLRPVPEISGAQLDLPSGRIPGGPRNVVPTPPRDPLQQLRTALSPDRAPILEAIRAKIPQAFYDRNFPLSGLEKATGVPTRKLAQIVPGAVAAGENDIRRFIVPVLRPVWRDRQHLEEYMTLRRMEDILARNPSAALPGNISGKAGVLAAQDALKAQIGTTRFEAIEKAADNLWRINREVNLKALLDEGIISDRMFVELVSTHPHYIPFRRADFTENVALAFARPEANLSSQGITRMGLEGSERALHEPLQSLIQETIKVRSLVARNQAAKGIVEALEEMERFTGDQIITRIQPQRTMRPAERVTGERVARSATGESSANRETISFFRNGERHVVEVPADAGRVAKGLEAEPDNFWAHFFRRMTAPLRAGAVTFNPAFTPVNVTRDAMSALYREKLIPFGPDYFAGMWAALRKNHLFTEAADAGTLMSGIVETMSRPTGRLRTLRLGALEVRSFRDLLTIVPRLIEEVNITAERGTRIAVFRKLRAQGLDELSAAVRSRDATVDFAKAGHIMRAVNQAIPFSNAAVQGTANIARTIRSNPKWALAFGAMAAMPTVLTRTNNLRFETSNLIPDYEYTRNWVIQVGEGTRGDGTKFPIYFKIPKGEIISMFSFVPEALFSLNRETEDRSAVEMLLEAGRDAVSNISPVDIPFIGRGGISSAITAVPFVGTGAALATDTNIFTGAPIVPRREENLLPEQQIGPETTIQANWLGGLFGVSPRMIDFAIKDYLAGAGEMGSWLISQGLEAAGFRRPEPFGAAVTDPLPEGAEAVSRAPGVRRFLGTRSTQVERQGFNLLDETSAKTNREFSKVPAMDRLGVRLGDVSKTISVVPSPEVPDLELTAEQRARYQQIHADLTLPVIEEFAQTLTGNDETQRDAAIREVGRLRGKAREQFLDEIDPTELKPLGEPADPQIIEAQQALERAFVARKALRDAGYWDAVERNPRYASSPEIAALYDRWVGKPPDAVLRGVDPGDPLLKEGVRRLMRSIRREVDAIRTGLLQANPRLDLYLVEYYGRAGVTPAGKTLRIRLERERKNGA